MSSGQGKFSSCFVVAGNGSGAAAVVQVEGIYENFAATTTSTEGVVIKAFNAINQFEELRANDYFVLRYEFKKVVPPLLCWLELLVRLTVNATEQN